MEVLSEASSALCARRICYFICNPLPLKSIYFIYIHYIHYFGKKKPGFNIKIVKCYENDFAIIRLQSVKEHLSSLGTMKGYGIYVFNTIIRAMETLDNLNKFRICDHQHQTRNKNKFNLEKHRPELNCNEGCLNSFILLNAS